MRIDNIPTVRYINMADMENEKTTKEMMMQKALKLFADKGYESVGVQELCTVCSVTKPTLYYYFSSKLGLFQAILDTDGAALHELTRKSMAYDSAEMEGEAFHKTLNTLIISMLDFARTHEDFFKLYYSLSASLLVTESQEAFSRYKAGIDELYDDLFRDASELFGNMMGFESMYARLFQSTASYAVFQAITGQMTLDYEAIDRITHAFLWGVAS